jgi:hypothetical protein
LNKNRLTTYQLLQAATNNDTHVPRVIWRGYGSRWRARGHWTSGNEDEKDERSEHDEMNESRQHIGAARAEGQKAKKKRQGQQQRVALGKFDKSDSAPHEPIERNADFRKGLPDDMTFPQRTAFIE